MKVKLNVFSYYSQVKELYNLLEKDILLIISSCFNINDESIDFIQAYPNKFIFGNIIFEFNIENWKTKENSLKIIFPVFTMESYLLDFDQTKFTIPLYSNFLDDNFNRKAFYNDMIKTIGKFNNNYCNLIYQNFSDIRLKYFRNDFHKPVLFKANLFSKPAVLISCNVSETITNYGYKPGEGRYYVHSYDVIFKDVNDCQNQFVIDKIAHLNKTNPKGKDVEELEMNPSDYYSGLQTEYFDLELSIKLNNSFFFNNEIALSKRNENFSHNPIIYKSHHNFEVFEHIVLIYIFTKYDMFQIEDFFNITIPSKERKYENMVLISQYYIVEKYLRSYMISDFNSLRKKIVTILWDKNFKGDDSYDLIMSSLDQIGASKADVNYLRYFYINFFSMNYPVDYDSFFVIFFNFFNNSDNKNL